MSTRMILYIVAGAIIITLIITGIYMNKLKFFTNATFVEPMEIQPYSTKITYSKGQELHFKEFILTYEGKEERDVPGSKLKVTHYNFEINCEGELKKISWSHRLSEIAPTLFQCQEKKFELEKASNGEKFGENEMIITIAPGSAR